VPFLNKTDGIPLFPGTFNDWRKQGLKNMTNFACLDSKNPAFIFENVASVESSSETSTVSSESSSATVAITLSVDNITTIELAAATCSSFESQAQVASVSSGY
jgi:hypothetical protein